MANVVVLIKPFKVIHYISDNSPEYFMSPHCAIQLLQAGFCSRIISTVTSFSRDSHRTYFQHFTWRNIIPLWPLCIHFECWGKKLYNKTTSKSNIILTQPQVYDRMLSVKWARSLQKMTQRRRLHLKRNPITYIEHYFWPGPIWLTIPYIRVPQLAAR